MVTGTAGELRLDLRDRRLHCRHRIPRALRVVVAGRAACRREAGGRTSLAQRPTQRRLRCEGLNRVCRSFDQRRYTLFSNEPSLANTGAFERFKEIASREDAEIDLAEAALVIAAAEYSDLDIDEYLHRLEHLGDLAAAHLSGAASERERVAALNHFLFEEQRFTGNQERYDDPRNSYFNDVLDRKLGIPITLSLVYMGVGRRQGMDVVGVGFPGHFLAKVRGAEEDIIVDPFFGTVMTLEACCERLRTLMGAGAVLEPEHHLRPATPREILMRMLTNLKHIAFRAQDFERALACCERIVLLAPDAPLELRDRGLAYEQLDAFAAALRDFERFLELAPNDSAAPNIEGRAARLADRVKRLH